MPKDISKLIPIKKATLDYRKGVILRTYYINPEKYLKELLKLRTQVQPVYFKLTNNLKVSLYNNDFLKVKSELKISDTTFNIGINSLYNWRSGKVLDNFSKISNLALSPTQIETKNKNNKQLPYTSGYLNQQYIKSNTFKGHLTQQYSNNHFLYSLTNETDLFIKNTEFTLRTKFNKLLATTIIPNISIKFKEIKYKNPKVKLKKTTNLSKYKTNKKALESVLDKVFLKQNQKDVINEIVIHKKTKQNFKGVNKLSKSTTNNNIKNYIPLRDEFITYIVSYDKTLNQYIAGKYISKLVNYLNFSDGKFIDWLFSFIPQNKPVDDNEKHILKNLLINPYYLRKDKQFWSSTLAKIILDTIEFIFYTKNNGILNSNKPLEYTTDVYNLFIQLIFLSEVDYIKFLEVCNLVLNDLNSFIDTDDKNTKTEKLGDLIIKLINITRGKDFVNKYELPYRNYLNQNRTDLALKTFIDFLFEFIDTLNQIKETIYRILLTLGDERKLIYIQDFLTLINIFNIGSYLLPKESLIFQNLLLLFNRLTLDNLQTLIGNLDFVYNNQNEEFQINLNSLSNYLIDKLIVLKNNRLVKLSEIENKYLPILESGLRLYTIPDVIYGLNLYLNSNSQIESNKNNELRILETIGNIEEFYFDVISFLLIRKDFTSSDIFYNFFQEFFITYLVNTYRKSKVNTKIKDYLIDKLFGDIEKTESELKRVSPLSLLIHQTFSLRIGQLFYPYNKNLLLRVLPIYNPFSTLVLNKFLPLINKEFGNFIIELVNDLRNYTLNVKLKNELKKILENVLNQNSYSDIVPQIEDKLNDVEFYNKDILDKLTKDFETSLDFGNETSKINVKLSLSNLGKFKDVISDNLTLRILPIYLDDVDINIQIVNENRENKTIKEVIKNGFLVYGFGLFKK